MARIANFINGLGKFLGRFWRILNGWLPIANSGTRGNRPVGGIEDREVSTEVAISFSFIDMKTRAKRPIADSKTD
ncbi:MAG: hypothetical protein ACLQOO_04410 [Terriglobia bacterium]